MLRLSRTFFSTVDVILIHSFSSGPPKLQCQMHLLHQPFYDKIIVSFQVFAIYYTKCVKLTRIKEDVSIYLAPIDSAKSQASRIEIVSDSFIYEIYVKIIIIMDIRWCNLSTCKFLSTIGSSRKSDCVPTSSNKARDLVNFWSHFNLIDINVSGLTTEKHNRNTSLFG